MSQPARAAENDVIFRCRPRAVFESGRDDCLAPGAGLAYRDLGAAGNRGQLQSYRVTLPSATMTEPTGVWRSRQMVGRYAASAADGRARDAHPLLHSTRKLSWVPRRDMAELHEIEIIFRTPAAF